jgi:hypothetical protein
VDHGGERKFRGRRTEVGGRKRKRKRKRKRRRTSNIEHPTLNIEVKRKRERSEVRGQRSLGKNLKIWHVLWHRRTWGRMPQGRTGTGCPSYEEEIEEAASSSSDF